MDTEKESTVESTLEAFKTIVENFNPYEKEPNLPNPDQGLSDSGPSQERSQ